MTVEIETVEMPISELKELEDNPRTIKKQGFEKLAEWGLF